MWSKKCCEILSKIIDEFNRKGIRYFILRNFEGLPQINSSKDVDIIIEPNSYREADLTLRAVFSSHGIEYIYKVQYDRVRCYYGMNLRSRVAIHIDLIEGYQSKGFEIFDFDELYSNTMMYKDMVVLNKQYDTVMLIIYKLVMSKELSPKYRVSISNGYALRATEVKDILSLKLGVRLSNKLCNLIEEDDYDKLEQLSHKISRRAKIGTLLNHPIKTPLRFVRFLCEKIYRIVICPRRYQNFIAVLAPDGTGKSTFIDWLIDEISHYYVSDSSKSHIFHHRPTILPNLGEFGEKSGLRKVDREFTNPHRGKPVGFVSSFLRMTYYWLDYLIGVPYLLRKDVKFDRFTIYDRYIYDFLVDPKRSRIALPYWFRECFTHLVAQPRIVFILSTDAATIYGRKQELTPEEIERQLCEYKKLARTNDRFILLDASKSPDELAQEAIKIIIDRFTQKV